MSNFWSNKIIPYFYASYIKRSYKKVSSTEIEDIYRKNDKIVVFVKDKKVAKNLAAIIGSLVNEKIETDVKGVMYAFEIEKYSIDEDGVKFFCANVDAHEIINFIMPQYEDVEVFKKDAIKKQILFAEKLCEKGYAIHSASFAPEYKDVEVFKKDAIKKQILFAEKLCEKGYAIHSESFDTKKCENISAFLSSFTINSKEAETSKGYLIQYIHYRLTNGSNFDEFYGNIVNTDALHHSHEFPYTFPIIKMCYEYFVNGIIPKSIYQVLLEDERENDYDCFISTRDSIKKTYELVEKDDECLVYKGNIKIYRQVSDGFDDFLKKIQLGRVASTYDLAEKIEELIFDFSGRVIGYKFTKSQIDNEKYVLDRRAINQANAVIFTSKLNDFVRQAYSNTNYKGNNNCVFDVEKSIIVSEIGVNTYFYITDIKAYYDLLNNNLGKTTINVMFVFFKLLLPYLNSRYGAVDTKECLMNYKEVRYLPPIVAKYFIKFALSQNVDEDYNSADVEKLIEQFNQFLDADTFTIDGRCAYDPRLEYNPDKVDFLFEYEVEKICGISKLEKGMTQVLSDGRVVIIFNRAKNISMLKAKVSALYEEVSKCTRIYFTHFDISNISKVIYKDTINDKGYRPVAGIITTPIRGKRLSTDELLKLNNRDFLKVAARLFTGFGKYYIPWDNIWMDDDFSFYVNIFEDNFSVRDSSNAFRRKINTKGEFLESLAAYLVQCGYNANAFLGIDFKQIDSDSNYLQDFVKTLDTYCEEHKIYFDGSKKICPVCAKTKSFVPMRFRKRANIIFKDEYAKHYRINEKYNVKVYRSECSNLAELEAFVDHIVSKRVFRDSYESKTQIPIGEYCKLGQECFIPYKKAVDENGKFIGYIYEAVQFEDNEENVNICIDINNQTQMRNLPRLKSLIRLMTQVENILQNDYGFTANPFSAVYLSRAHKKQVQIINIDLINSVSKNVVDTYKWTCDYIFNSIVSDPLIEIDLLETMDSFNVAYEDIYNSTTVLHNMADLSEISKAFNMIKSRLIEHSNIMTKYCSVHKMYYTNNFVFCPKCVTKEQIANVETETVSKQTYIKREPTNEGGEAFIYDDGNNTVVKVFKDEVNISLKSVVLIRVFAKKQALEAVNVNNNKFKFVIPQRLMMDSDTGNVFGYVMDKVEGVPISNLRDKEEIRRLNFTKKDVFHILFTVAKGIEALHENNIFIGDLNGRNILFDANKNVFFLDFDGMGIDEISPEFCTDGYIDPVSKKKQNITMKDDWYSFAIQAFYYLTYTHPFNGIYIDEDTDKPLDIVEKMEKKKSLLGKHNITPPAIAEKWDDWMSKELKNAFLSIFEGDNRESILPYLVSQYKGLYIGDTSSLKNVRINPKFMAKEVRTFEGNVVRLINHYSSICKYGNTVYLSVLRFVGEEKQQIDIPLTHCENIQNVFLSDNNKYAFVLYDSGEVIVINLDNKNVVLNMRHSPMKYNRKDIFVDGCTIHFKEKIVVPVARDVNGLVTEPRYIIYTYNLESTTSSNGKIKFMPKLITVGVLAKNQKYVFVKRVDIDIDDVYCNDKRLDSIGFESVNTEYNIICDDVAKLWLVINSEGNGMVIDETTGEYEKIVVKEVINDINLWNISFNKGKIYIPDNDCLHIINTKNGVTKKMECREIMTPNSKLYDFNNDGFSVMTDQTLYEVRRG